MATHMSRDDMVAVVDEEGWYDSESFWRKESVNRRKSIYHKADVGVYSVSCALDLGNLRQIGFCRPGIRNDEMIGIAAAIILTQGALHVLTWCVAHREVVGSTTRGQGRSPVVGVGPSPQTLTRGGGPILGKGRSEP